MSVELHFNRQKSCVEPGSSLFDYADALGIKVPTSCRKQGKCKECLVEIVAGMECLSPKSPEEKHLKENFRLSCRCRIVADSGLVCCHTMRRGDMRIERHALQLPTRLPRGPDHDLTERPHSLFLSGAVAAGNHCNGSLPDHRFGGRHFTGR